MQNKTALIVDDSRTACLTLQRMLEREEFQVDVLGNAEDAVGYLRDHRPGIIFMDHLMPGMDGFQAVKEIKSNSLASQIPIVMYTAKSGDLYVGQAQALGAVDILPKPPTRELLRAVFRRIDERASAANDAGEAPVQPQAVAPEPDVETPLTGLRAENEPFIEAAPPARAPDKPAGTAPAIAVSPAAPGFLDEVTAEPADGSGPGWAAVAAIALVAALGGFFAGARSGSAPDGAQPLADAMGWALSQSIQYPYGEAPFGGSRVELVQGLVERLQAAGFQGTLRLQGHAGQFCLVATPGGWKVADAAAPIDACDVKGFFNKQDARVASGRQTPEFRALLESPAVAGSGIRVQIEGLGDEGRRAPYPTPDAVSSAGEWNAVAARNNSISVTLIPDA